jgi:lysophospholipase L1-like esterase
MSFMNFSGAVRPGYQAKRTSTIFVGDSITWGYGLNQNQTIGYGIQTRINATTSFSPATWGSASPGLDVTCRNVIMDDTTTSPFQGGSPPNGSPLLSQSGALTAGLGTYPFSDTTNNTNGSNVSTAYPATSDCPNAITLPGSASISWTATYPSSTGYIIVGLMGAGTVEVRKGATVLSTLTSGGTFNATVVSGLTSMTLTSVVTGTLTNGMPLAGTGIATGATISSFSGSGIGDTITMSAVATASSTNTAYLALATQMAPNSGAPNVVGPFSGASGTATYSIVNISSGTAVVVGVLQPTPVFPTTYNQVQINGRNSYAISDYSSPSGDIIQQQIMATATQSNAYPATSSLPIYVLSVGTVSLYDSSGATDRRLTPTQYSSQLSTLASALRNSAYTNYGRIILTVPPVPSASFSLLSPYTLNDYRFSIINLAKTLGCGYIDLSRVRLTSADYQADGLHPNATGASKLAKHYNSMLEF